jgi:hypothetical protein
MLSCSLSLLVAVLLCLSSRQVDGFSFRLPVDVVTSPVKNGWKRQEQRPIHRLFSLSIAAKKDYEGGEVGQGDNWIEKSFPVETEEGANIKKVDDFDLGISGKSFQTGPLSKRMFDAIVSRASIDMSDEIIEAYTIYAMDYTAKVRLQASLCLV